VALISARLRSNPRFQVAAADRNKPIGKNELDKTAVALLQSCLMELGFTLSRSLKPNGLPDGKFGAETDEALKSFQRKFSLTPDGMAGPLTLGRMDALYVARSAADAAKLNVALNLPRGPWTIS